MTTLVTGATGFLGAALSRRLLSENVRVRAIRRPHSQTDLLGNTADDIEWVDADVLDAESIEEASRGVARIYHCAAYLGFDGNRDRSKLFRVNVAGTANIVNAALTTGVQRLVHTSSVAALGISRDSEDCLDESAEWRASPVGSAYGESKYRAELEIQRGIAEGLDAVIVNPSLIMGEGRPGENTRLLVDKIRSGSIPFLPTGATNVVDVLDVVDGHLRAMELGGTGERYILSGENLTWRQIISTLAEALGARPPRRTLRSEWMIPAAFVLETVVRFLGRRPIVTRENIRLSSRTSCYRNDKSLRELGWSFRPFVETAHRVAASLKSENPS